MLEKLNVPVFQTCLKVRVARLLFLISLSLFPGRRCFFQHLFLVRHFVVSTKISGEEFLLGNCIAGAQFFRYMLLRIFGVCVFLAVAMCTHVTVVLTTKCFC